jgi:hypothetical protein
MPLVRPDPGLFRSLFGSHLTLGLNLCGLVAAAYAIIEGAYIVHQHSGYYRPQDASVFLFPALVMFIVRNRIFSCCFLVLYIGLSTQLFLKLEVFRSALTRTLVQRIHWESLQSFL